MAAITDLRRLITALNSIPQSKRLLFLLLLLLKIIKGERYHGYHRFLWFHNHHGISDPWIPGCAVTESLPKTISLQTDPVLLNQASRRHDGSVVSTVASWVRFPGRPACACPSAWATVQKHSSKVQINDLTSVMN